VPSGAGVPEAVGTAELPASGPAVAAGDRVPPEAAGDRVPPEAAGVWVSADTDGPGT
jgi:hypothetical protein